MSYSEKCPRGLDRESCYVRESVSSIKSRIPSLFRIVSCTIHNNRVVELQLSHPRLFRIWSRIAGRGDSRRELSLSDDLASVTGTEVLWLDRQYQ